MHIYTISDQERTSVGPWASLPNIYNVVHVHMLPVYISPQPIFYHLQLSFIRFLVSLFLGFTHIQQIFATKMGNEDSAFLDINLSELSKETQALTEIIIAAVKQAVQCIKNVVAKLSKEIFALTTMVTKLQSCVETKDKELSEMWYCLNILADQVD